MQELVDLRRLQSRDRSLAVDQAFFLHINGDLDRCFRGPFAVACLQHEETVVLDRKLHVLHVGVMRFQQMRDPVELLIDFGERFFHLRDGLRCSDTGNDVLALGIHQEFTEDTVLTIDRASCERNARAGCLAHVAEDHRLHVNGSPQTAGDAVNLSVQDRTFVVPGAEDRLHGFHQLVLRILREFSSDFCFDKVLVRSNDILQIGRRKLCIVLIPFLFLLAVKDLIEFGFRDLQYDVAEHLDEAAVAVIGKPFIAGLSGKAYDAVIVESQIQDGVHHAGHGNRCPGADGDQQRVFGIPEGLAHNGLEFLQFFENLCPDLFIDHFAVFVILEAGVGGNGETERNRQTDLGHFSQVRALSSKETSHILGALVE